LLERERERERESLVASPKCGNIPGITIPDAVCVEIEGNGEGERVSFETKLHSLVQFSEYGLVQFSEYSLVRFIWNETLYGWPRASRTHTRDTG